MPPERRTLRVIAKELVDTPFAPLLFISKFIEKIVEGGPHMQEYGALALLFTLLWVFSDAIDIEFIKKNVVGKGDGE